MTPLRSNQASRRDLIRVGVVGAAGLTAMSLPSAVAAASVGGSSGSAIGSDWTVRFTSASTGSNTGWTWSAVAHDGSRFVAVNTSGYAMTSDDGVTWSTPALTPLYNSVANTSLLMNCITYGDGLFVASGSGGGIKTQRVLRSADGVTWTRGTTPDYFTNYYGAAYGNGTYVVVGQQFGEPACCMTSTDGSTFTGQTGLSTSFAYYGAAYGNSMFVAVGSSSAIMTSPDGITWTQRTAPASGKTLRSVVWSGDKFVAVGDGGTAWYSANGTNWSAASLGSPMNGYSWKSVAHGSGVYVAVTGDGSTQQAMTSIDGVSWTASTTNALSTWSGLSYGESRFVAVGGYGSGDPRYQVMTSP